MIFEFQHVDVFSKNSLNGNGLITVFDFEKKLSKEKMQAITQEFKQMETIFLIKKSQFEFIARIFTVEEELDFAGHPILGASASIHHQFFSNEEKITLKLHLNKKTVFTTSEYNSKYYYVEMDQGEPKFLGEVPKEKYDYILKSLNLKTSNLSNLYPIEVVSTGLPYLLVPLTNGLENAKITTSDFSELLTSLKAKFAYLFEVSTLECRSWDNSGLIEDVATGSAAGPLCGYLIKHKIKESGEIIQIHQGRFVGRPSVINTKLTNEKIFIGGDVSLFGKGKIEI
jgi:PhzF family phenazine biosynthesis protein